MSAASGEKERQALLHRRSRAVRTAWALAAIVVVIFVAFILSGVLGQAPGV